MAETTMDLIQLSLTKCPPMIFSYPWTRFFRSKLWSLCTQKTSGYAIKDPYIRMYNTGTSKVTRE